jgi:HPt (histidine-containing phosphotransfer) domain-containing protein
VLRDTLERYVISLKADFQRIAAAVAKNDAKQVEMFAHRMKGAARIVGGEALARCSEALELAAGTRDWRAVQRDLPPLSEAVTRIDQMYNEIAAA